MLNFLAEVLKEYGMTGILAVGLIVCLMLLLKYFFNQQNKSLGDNIGQMADKMSSAISDQNDKLIGSLQDSQNKLLDNQMNMISYLMESGKEKDKSVHHGGLEQRKSMLYKVNNILRQLCEHTNSNRVCIIEFHNSKENLNGLPFLWYDIQAEYFTKGRTPIMNLVKDYQAFNLMIVIDRINKSAKGYTVLTKTDLADLETEAPTLYNHLVVKLNAKEVVYVGLYGENNILIGLLAFEYNGKATWEANANESIVLENVKVIEELLKFNKDEKNLSDS